MVRREAIQELSALHARSVYAALRQKKSPPLQPALCAPRACPALVQNAQRRFDHHPAQLCPVLGKQGARAKRGVNPHGNDDLDRML